MKIAITILAAILLAGTAFANPMSKAGPLPASDTKWTPLVPQLGDKGPQFSVLFGDVKKGPVSLLLKLPAGFTPGPHTHSSEYSGVVIYGEMEDFDPGAGATAEKITAGQRWAEPANRPHDNLCTPKGECLAVVFFPKGFDVKPLKK